MVVNFSYSVETADHGFVSGQKRNVRKPAEAKKKRIARRQRDMLIEKAVGRYFDKSLINRYI